MDAWFLLMMFGHWLGIPLAVVGIVLSILPKTRWFAAPVIFFAVAGATIAVFVDRHMPYTPWAVFWGIFTGISIVLGAASVATAIVAALANGDKGKHAV